MPQVTQDLDFYLLAYFVADYKSKNKNLTLKMYHKCSFNSYEYGIHMEYFYDTISV